MLLFLFLLFYFYLFLFLFQGTRVTQRGIYQWIDEKYKIPSCEPTIKSGMIDVSYVLVFKVSMRCCPDLVIRLPITIGTNPHIFIHEGKPRTTGSPTNPAKQRTEYGARK